ncbi:hypothetical protein PspLS_10547 [Pyricularia sp. CBS 133598]|nr:hypothetical protein PspLS_10547 [Pyricularia sp. CBS 133598]
MAILYTSEQRTNLDTRSVYSMVQRCRTGSLLVARALTSPRAQYPGRGSHFRRCSIKESSFGDEEMLFEDRWAEFKSRYTALVRELDENLNLVVDTCINKTTADLDILRKENAALGGDDDPEFHSQVETT